MEDLWLLARKIWYGSTFSCKATTDIEKVKKLSAPEMDIATQPTSTLRWLAATMRIPSQHTHLTRATSILTVWIRHRLKV